MTDLVNDSVNELLSEPSTIEYAEPRTPHIGHAIFFLVFALGVVTLTEIAAIGITHAMPAFHAIPVKDLAEFPKVTVISSLIAYMLVLVLAVFLFPAVWQRSFADGISWNLDAAKRSWKWLVPAGVVVALASATLESFLSIPKDLPVDKFFDNRVDLWLVTVLGTLLAPVFEEICFRGFLLPAVAIAWDWIALPRTPEARLQWQSTNTLSRTGLAIGAVLTSIGFAAMHGKQLSFTMGPLVVLFFVSLVFSLVRIRLRSVAASSLIHASYNGFIFVVTFVQTGGYRHLGN